MKRFILSLLLALGIVGSAVAGTSTITTLDSTGATKTYAVITNGATNFLSQIGLCDGTAGAQCVAVKAASTAALATDPALVVSVSPNTTAGMFVDGWDTTQGTKGDAVCATATGSCSLIALMKFNNAQSPVLAAGSAIVGKVGIDQTTPGTTNNVSVSYGSTALVANPCQANALATTPININSAATSVIVAGTSAKKTYICSMMLFSAGTTNVGIVQGSGATCGTSTLGLIGGATAATGPNLTAQAGFVAGSGIAPIASTTVNANDICLINGSAVQVSGFIVTAVQ